MSRNQTIAITALLAIVALLAGMLGARALLHGGGASQIALATGTLLEPPRPLPQFAFTDHEGAAFEPDRLRNQWTLLFFGFTSCPDVCPTTLGVLAQVENRLADLPEAQRPHVVLVSVDPRRDTPAHLASYVRFFSPQFVGVTGTQASIDEFTRQMGVPVAIRPLGDSSDPDNYTVDHSASIFLIDPDGSLRALFSLPHSADVIAEDYRRIVSMG